MRWQRPVRIGLAVAALAFAATIYLLTRERPEADPPAPVPTADLDATQIGGPGRIIVVRGEQKVGEITFTRTSQYADGRTRFEQARYTDVRGFALGADLILAKGSIGPGERPMEYELQGAVTLEDDAGLTVTSSGATYDDRAGLLTMPEEVTFSRGRLSGRSIGAVYERDRDVVRLLADASARVAADEAGKGGADATATRMTLERGQKSLLLDGQARIVTETETLAGDIANLYFTDDESALRFMELRGHASVVPVDAAGGAPEMRGDNITIGVHPDGRTVQHATLTGGASLQLSGDRGRRSIRGSWIDLFTAADGRTVTRLEAKDDVVVELPATPDAPAREIRSATLLATGKDTGLDLARFQTGVRYVEKGAAAGKSAGDRTVTSTSLVLTLGGDIESIERAEFQRDVVFHDGDVRANADLAIYDSAKQRVHLTPGTRTPPRDPQVSDGFVTVDAAAIDLDMKTHDLVARGRVRTLSARKGDRRAGALFDGDDPMIGSAEALDYRQASRTATYTGSAKSPARVLQGANVVEGATITLSDETGNLDAKARVNTTFVMAPGDRSAKPVEYRTTAESFTYDDKTRVAIYRSGDGTSPVEMTGSDGSTTVGRIITLRLADAARTVETLTVEGGVWAKLPDTTEVSGDVLDVNEATGLYVLRGTHAKVKSAPEGDGKKCTLTTGGRIEFNARTKKITQPPGQAFNTATPIACTASIR